MPDDTASALLALANSAGLVPKAVISLPSAPWAGVYILDPTQPSAAPAWMPSLDISIRQPTDADLQAPSLVTTLEVVGLVLIGLAAYGGYRLVRG